MAVYFNLGPCSICQKTPASMKVGTKSCPECRAIFRDLCAPCGSGRCPKCRKRQLDDVDRIFPYSLFRAIAEADDHEIHRLLNSTHERLDEIVNENGSIPLAVAARSNSSATAERLCKLLIERGASANARAESGRTALMEMMLFRGKYYGSVANLLRSSVNAQDDFGVTALMFAAEGAGVFGARRANMTAVRDLVMLGADLLLQDKLGLTALGHAMKSNDKGTNQVAVDYLEEQTLQQFAVREFRNHNVYEFDDKGRLQLGQTKKAKRIRTTRKVAPLRSSPHRRRTRG